MNYQITEQCHRMLEPYVSEGSICIDATMGNGRDTLFLSKKAGVSGRVLAFDIQQEALEHTGDILKREEAPDNVELFLESHEKIGCYASENSVSCIVFNLGYLPSGDHSLATCADSTCAAIQAGLPLLRKGGILSLCIYSGGDTGFEEKERVLELLRALDSKRYLVLTTEYYNRPNHPPMIAQVIRLH